MAHFAKINNENIVTNVHVIHNAVITDETGNEQEALGVAFLRNIYKEPTANWKQTSIHTRGNQHSNGGTPLRYNFAGIGYIYDPVVDAFRQPQPFPSWTLNASTQLWEPPVAKPVPYEGWDWDESVTNWRDGDGIEYSP
jgi:hypothetical protein|tara:strand:- start:2095 stop:2511 length:417 start_codon:yes stop_codon:yes gene_type:complete